METNNRACFEIGALFHSAIPWGKEGGNFKINIDLDSVESFLYFLCSRGTSKSYTWYIENTPLNTKYVLHMHVLYKKKEVTDSDDQVRVGTLVE